MAGPSPIEWTDATWNPIGGCSIKSPGCINCYAQKLAGTRLAKLPLYAGTTTTVKGKPVFNGTLTAAPDDHPVWTWPLRWRGSPAAKAEARRSRIFVGDMSDLFHEDRALRDIIRTVAVALLCQHDLQFLTKRPDRMRALMLNAEFMNTVDGAMDDIAPAHWHDREIDARGGWPNPRLWLGFSAERQVEFDERWAFARDLAEAGWTVFVSIEPLLGPVALPPDFLALGRRVQVIVGGESGRDARPMNPQWARDIRDQCIATGVAYFHKQNGEFVSVSEVEGPGFHYTFLDHRTVRRVGKKAAGRILDGRTWNEFPEARP